MLFFTGAPSGPCTVTIPAVARIGWVSNRCTGTVILATPTAVTNLTVTPGASFLYQCDGTTVTQIPIGGAGVLNAAGGVVVSNGNAYASNDAAGIARPLLSLDAGGNTNNYMAGGTAWRVLNQAANTTLFSIAAGGAASFAAGLTVSGAVNIASGLTVTGAVNLSSLTVSGTTTFTTTQSSSAGLIATGLDAGGFNLRFVAGNYGTGWRNDGVNTTLLLTSSGAPLGAPNALRPLSIANATGALSLDATGVGVTFGGRVTSTDHVLTAGSLYLANGQSLVWRDSGGTNRSLMFMGTDNFTNVVNAGAVGWRVLNQAGTFALVTIDNVGNTTFAGPTISVNGALNVSGTAGLQAITCTTLTAANTVSATGNVFGAGGIFTNAIVSGNIAGGTATWSGASTMTGVINANGSTNRSGVGGVVDGSGGTSPGGAFAWNSIGMSVVAANGVSGVGFYATSDARAKTDITDITPEEAYSWITRGRARHFTMNGSPHAGFIAQEDVAAGRGAAVVSIADSRPPFVNSDGVAPAGQRLLRRYEHDIAYLTACLQGALARIDALEAKAHGA